MTGIDVQKALLTTTNSGAELATILDPVIQRTLNDVATMRNLISRPANIGKWATWVANTGRNTSTGSMGEWDPVTTGNQVRVQPQATMKIIKVGVEVSDLMIEAARRGGSPIGDMLAEEVLMATKDVMVEENKQIFGESTSPTGTGSYITSLKQIIDDGTNYSTVYDQTRSASAADDWLDGTLVDAASGAVSYDLLQQAKRACLEKGAQKRDLMFVSDHTQLDLCLQLFQDQQRFVGKTQLAAGFGDTPTVDGIPWYADVDCTASVIYAVDRSVFSMRVLKEFGIKNLPTNKLGEVRAIAAFEELVCKQPSRNAQIHTLATTL